MIVVDTNILVYAAVSGFDEHEPCRAWMDRQLERPTVWFLTWPIVYEFLRVTTHGGVLSSPIPLPESWRFIRALLESNLCQFLVPGSRHAILLAELVREESDLAGNILHDIHTVMVMRENGVSRICTRDNGFRRFRDIEIVDPLKL